MALLDSPELVSSKSVRNFESDPLQERAQCYTGTGKRRLTASAAITFPVTAITTSLQLNFLTNVSSMISSPSFFVICLISLSYLSTV
jgi:hypothetical protein